MDDGNTVLLSRCWCRITTQFHIFTNQIIQQGCSKVRNRFRNVGTTNFHWNIFILFKVDASVDMITKDFLLQIGIAGQRKLLIITTIRSTIRATTATRRWTATTITSFRATTAKTTIIEAWAIPVGLLIPAGVFRRSTTAMSMNIQEKRTYRAGEVDGRS